MGKFSRLNARAKISRRPFLTQAIDDVVRSFDFTAKIYDARCANRSYSQFGEDKVIKTFLPERFGSYLDIGAGHPIRNSNSYLFYKSGWHGTLIEPISDLANAAKRIRPRDIIHSCLIGKSSLRQPKLDFFQFSPTELSTTDVDRANALQLAGHVLTKKYAIQVQHVSEFTSHISPEDSFFLTIDVEGLDLEILKSIDWQTFKPRVVCVENPSMFHFPNEIGELMKKMGYRLASCHVISAIYVHESYYRH
jgi:Methyltransferase FkbM domain